MSEQTQFQEADFYTRRYILSSCMSWNDVNYLLRNDGTQKNSWKRAATGRIRLLPNEKMVEIDAANYKRTVLDAVIKEADDERKTPYILITCPKNESITGPNAKTEFLSVTSRKEFLNLFYSAIKYVLEQPNDQEFIQSKNEEFVAMINNAKTFLVETDSELPPKIPPLPPNLNFASELPKNPS